MLNISKNKYKGKEVVSLKKVIIAFIITFIISFGTYQIINRNIKIADNNEIIESIRVGDYTGALSESRKTTARSSESINRTDVVKENKEEVQESNQDETAQVDNTEVEKNTDAQAAETVVEPEAQNNYVSISDVTISKTMDLTVRTGLSKEDFKTLIASVKQDKSKFFYNNSDTIYDMCEKYEINEVFFCGLISAESGWDIASNHRRTYNYISLMSGGSLIKFGSVEEGLEAAASKLHNNYLTPGGKFYHGKTLAGVKTNFCPASSTWVDLVYGRMKQIIK